MTIESNGLFTWEEWDQVDTLANTYYNVIFLKDFGSIKKNEHFDFIQIFYDKQIIECYRDPIVEAVHVVKYDWIPRG